MSNIRIVIENENNLKQITNFSRKKKYIIYIYIKKKEFNS